LILLDTLTNLVAGLFTSKDKLASDRFALICRDKGQLDAAYRGDWIARKIIDVPPFDMTREWRAWQAEDDQIESLEAEEKRLDVRRKVNRALRLARLYGGSALVLGVGDGDPARPLPAIGKGGLRYLHAMSRWEITAGELDRDVLSPTFMEPSYYQVSSSSKGTVRIHPSRVVRLIGAELPDEQLQGVDGWGDSILQAVWDAVHHAGLTAQGIASLIHEAKVDVIKIPRLSESLSTEGYANRLVERFTLANTLKSINNTLVLDGEEEWDRKQTSFAQLPEVLDRYLQIAAGAADIPATRLLGQSPAGMNATGESDIRNYYDRIAAEQNVTLTPALGRLDEALIMSALGARPPEIHYEWTPLWGLSEIERADVALKRAQTTDIYARDKMLPPPVLAKIVPNQLTEDGVYPGIEAAMAEYKAGQLEEPDWMEPDPVTDPATEQQQPTTDGGGPNADRPFVEDKRRGRARGGKGGRGHYNPNQPRGPHGRWIATGAGHRTPLAMGWPGGKRMKAFVDAAVANTGSKARLHFGPVRNAEAVRLATGLNVAGWKRKLGADEVRKILKDHGVASSERARGQIAVTRSDFKRIRSIVERPDRIMIGGTTKGRALPTIVYQKRLGGVTYTLVEEMQPKRKGLQVKTMWKR